VVRNDQSLRTFWSGSVVQSDTLQTPVEAKTLIRISLFPDVFVPEVRLGTDEFLQGVTAFPPAEAGCFESKWTLTWL